MRDARGRLTGHQQTFLEHAASVDWDAPFCVWLVCRNAGSIRGPFVAVRKPCDEPTSYYGTLHGRINISLALHTS
jgi:hypothetical protein